MDSGVLGQSWQQLHDFLQSLYAQQGASPGGADGVNPYAAAASIAGPLAAQGTSPTGAMPGGGVMDYQAMTPGAPGMGYPALQAGSPDQLPLPPMNQVASPSPVAPLPPVRPRAALAAPRPKIKLDPAKTDLGMNPRFTTVQYGVGGARGPLSSNPIYTALNLGA
jgi:hypothetical protein